jgi:hypothetical protein
MTFLIILPISLFIIFPLALFDKMSGFRYISIISLLSLFYIMIVLVAELPAYA